MFSPFVKGLMSATLLTLGLSALLPFTYGIARQAPAAILFLYGFGIPLVALALLLFTSSAVMPRIAFWILLVLGLCQILFIFEPFKAPIYHPATSTHIFYAVVLLFPCSVALWNRKRRGGSRSNKSLEPTAGLPDA
jgi:hypothetical protein